MDVIINKHIQTVPLTVTYPSGVDLSVIDNSNKPEISINKTINTVTLNVQKITPSISLEVSENAIDAVARAGLSQINQKLTALENENHVETKNLNW